MDDLDLDRELRAGLAVTPSPEFVARVRTKIAEAPRPSIAAGWLKLAAAVVCGAVVAIAVALPRESAQLKQEAQLKLSPTEIAPGPAQMAPPIVRLKPSTTTVRPPSVRTVVVPTFRSARSSAPSEPPLPEVIIAADDVEALRQFVSGTRDRRFIASFEETPAPTAWVMNDLVVKPITIEPLDSAPAHNN